MKRFFVVTVATAIVLLGSSQHLLAQRFRGNVREIIRQLETDTDSFKSSLDRALDHSPLNGSRTEDEINGYVKNFEEATDRLRDRAEDHEYSPGLAREVLNRGRAINNFMATHRLGKDAETDWARVRSNLNRLAAAYNLRWRW